MNRPAWRHQPHWGGWGAFGRLGVATRRKGGLPPTLAPLAATDRRSRLRRGNPKGGQMATEGATRGDPQPRRAGGEYTTEPNDLEKKGRRGGGKTPVILYGGAPTDPCLQL